MSMIYIRTKPGRRAYFEGRVIPEDKFVPVTETSYIRRLIDHWGDVEVQAAETSSTSQRAAAPPRAPVHTPATAPAKPKE